MADTKISALPLRTVPAPTDEVATVAGGVNYRTPLGSIATSVLYDVERSGVVGDGTADDSDELLEADGVAIGLVVDLFINSVCKVDSDLTLTSRVQFGPGGRLKPASGVTVTLAGGYVAPTTRHVFDISLGGNVWSTVDCDVSARNYGAVSDGAGGADFNPATSLLPHGTDNRAAFQALIDCRLYFQKAGAVYLDAGDYYVAGPLMVGYGDQYRSIDVIGAGLRYSTSSNFAGTTLMTDWMGALLEVQGARGMVIQGITFEGPFYDWITDTGMGFAPTPLYDPYDHNNWISPAGRAVGALCRYKMSCGIHIDSRCGTKPVAIVKTAVRLVVTDAPNATGYENGDSVQGVTLATGDRILFAAPIDVDGWPGHTANGIYEVQASGLPLRAADMDTVAEFPNAAVTCSGGTHAGEQWVCNSASVTTLGTYPADFRQFDGTLSYPDYTYPAWIGIVTQYGKSLSSAVTIKHCYFKGFGCAVGIKGCDADGNADYVRMEYCSTLYNAYAFAWGHGQGRVQGLTNCQFAWSRALISTSVIGRQSGKGQLSAINTELAGSVDILDIPTMDVSGGVTLINGYTESGNRIGRVTTTSGGAAGFEISSGHFSALHYNWGRVPRYMLDCDGVGLRMSPHMNISWLAMPFIIKGDPLQCHLNIKLSVPIWMVPTDPPASPPANVSQAEAIFLNSTGGVLFLNAVGRIGPWTGSTATEVWAVTTPFARASRAMARHTGSSVTATIPFFAETTGAGDLEPIASPIPVALGYRGKQLPYNATTHIASISEAVVTPAAPALPRTVMTLTLGAGITTTVGEAQNSGYVPGSIILDRNSGNLYLVDTFNMTTKVITAELLNNYVYATGVGYTPVALNDSIEFFPCGHYTPGVGLELTWADASDTVTYRRADLATTDGAQLPVGAAMMVNEIYDPLTPIIRSRSGIKTSSVAGTIVFDGVARATVPTPLARRAGIFFIPRVIAV